MSARLAGRDLTHRDGDWAGLRVVVCGLGVSGFAAADALAQRGAHVVAVDGGDSPSVLEHARVLRLLDVDVRLGAGHTERAPAQTALVVTSPGWRPDQPLLAAAARDGIPVWGEVELAWRMRAREGAAPWLTITGTNGKTTTVRMLASILQAAGLRSVAVGNVGTPLLEAVLDPEPHDVLAVELSSFQLHWQESVQPRAA
ncbi:MAG TPA: Mur ligase family protein, partial [Segeticoccus sp.]|nr:Mur ligase family protein [Segeticoccus sp.]